MDRRDRQPRSSLPTSLIPHLYAAPRDSSTRTTLTSHSDDSDQDRSHISSFPPEPPGPSYFHPRSSFPSIPDDRQLPPVLPANPIYRSSEPSSNLHRSSSTYSNQTLFFPPLRSAPPPTLPSLASLSADIFPRSLSWREGEAGPSSLVHPRQRDYGSRQNRGGSSQLERVIYPPPNPSFGYGSAREPRRQGYYSPFSSVSPSHQSAFHNTPFPPPLPPLQHPSPVEPQFSFDRRDAYSYPQVGSLSISGSSPPDPLRQVSTPEREPSGSEPLSVDIGSNEGDDSHKDKKRRADSMDIDDNPKKSSRKTAVACNFCRGRKLRCNGAKPSCYNCTVRKFECEYVSTQRRRGPGKAPKGSRSRKGRSGSSSNIIGDRLPTMVPDYEVSPDLRPYTSILSLDTFGFQPPDSSPQYPSDRHEPLMRRQHPRSRTSRSRDTSSEDRSDEKDIHRNQSGS